MTERNKDLVQIIKDNPGCIATVDNDCWWLQAAPTKPIDEMTEDEREAWYDRPYLASDSDVFPRGSGYGSGCTYGGDLLQALAEIVGIKVESV